MDLASEKYETENPRNPAASCINNGGIPVMYHRWDIDWKPQVWFYRQNATIYFDCTDQGGIKLPRNWL